jgi:predicted enzyme related to lactoylglutathione lyase
MNNVGYFEIQATDPDRVVAFYERVFGWRFVEQPQITAVRYFYIEGAGTPGGLLQRPVPTPEPPAGTNAFVCSMQVESFERTAELILEHGGTVAMERFAVPGRCWQGYFIDCDGNVFGIFEVDESAA